jgi:hypothetical protein
MDLVSDGSAAINVRARTISVRHPAPTFEVPPAPHDRAVEKLFVILFRGGRAT